MTRCPINEPAKSENRDHQFGEEKDRKPKYQPYLRIVFISILALFTLQSVRLLLFSVYQQHF